MDGLFDDEIARSSAPAENSESNFAFFNRSDWPDVFAIRAHLESWFDAYPGEGKSDLRNRFRSRDDGQHLAAWWELYLFGVFSALGYELEPHPSIEGTTRHPDFRVRAPDGRTFLLEAVTTRSGIVRDPDRHEGRENVLLDALNQIKCAEFGVIPDVISTGDLALSTSKVKSEVIAWLDGLDPADPRWDNRDSEDELVIKRDGWHVVLTAWRFEDWEDPQTEPDDRLLMGGPLLVGDIDDEAKFRAALESKRKRYGSFGEPYLVAILADDFSLDDRDILGALLGKIDIVADPGKPGSARRVRRSNGLWLRIAGPFGQNVSGILVSTKKLNSWTLATALPELWLNPWASHPLPVDLPFPRGEITPGNLNDAAHVPATRSASDVLGLPHDWPGDA